MLCFIDNDTYEDFLEKNSYDKEIYLNQDFPKAIVLDYAKFYNYAEGRYYAFHMLSDDVQSVDLKEVKEMGGYYFWGKEFDEEGNEFYLFENRNHEDGEEELKLPIEEATQQSNIKIGAVSERKPFCVNPRYDESITFYTHIVPLQLLPAKIPVIYGLSFVLKQIIIELYLIKCMPF